MNNIYFSSATFQKINSDAVEKIRKLSLRETQDEDDETVEQDKEDDDDVFGEIF